MSVPTMLAQEARLTDGEADVPSHGKSKPSTLLRTFADGGETDEKVDISQELW